MQDHLPQEERVCTWTGTGCSRTCSRKTPIPAMMQGGCSLSGWQKWPPSSPQSLRGLCVCVPQMQRQKKPSHFNETSVSAWLEGLLWTYWDHRLEVIFFCGCKHHARHTFFHATHSYTESKNGKVSCRFGNLPVCTYMLE